MNATPYTEDSLVQQTAADYLAHELGWESVYAYNNEDFGQDSLLGRESECEVVLTCILRKKLAELNPGLPDVAYENAVQEIISTTTSQTMVSINREKYDLMRDGVTVEFKDDEGEQIHQRLRVFDFDTPENNHFLCVREFWIQGDLYRRRADLIGFVNGLPLLFMECKNINYNLKIAFEQNYSDYCDTIPHLFHHNAVVMFCNGEDAKVGSITSKWEHFHEWKRLAEQDPGLVDMETMLKGVCERRNFLDLFENFILFDEYSGEFKKILARNHQFLGVNRAIKSVHDRKVLQHKLGVFWHTQGAGKSYSMVLFTRKIHRKLGRNFTFLVLTDRDDLDTQIYKTFTGCGVVNHDQEPCRASTGQHLNQLLSEHKSYVFSLIQKFNQDVDPNEGYTQRDDIIVISDEAHRTQYGTMALNLRNALPNASYIGFTGTPLFKDDERTKQVFGDYISVYDFQRAAEDNTTAPLYFDARGDKLNLAKGVNQRIADKLEELDVAALVDSDINVAQRLERELRRDYHIVTAKKRLDQVAKDFVQHYATAWKTGKAMIICIDKITCVRMHNLITKYWDQKITELENPVFESPTVEDIDEQEFAQLQPQIKWMRETRIAVVVSEEQGEVEKFKQWNLDISPHRRLINTGIDLPPSIKDEPQFRNMQRMELDDAFKAEQHPFRIAIVCAMWLTGFDVPCLANLYLDKPLKAHTLMQAIARANRIHEGKNNGMIVDYCGILKHLRSALATYGGYVDGERGDEEPEKDLVKPAEELLDKLAETIVLVREFLDEGGAPLDDIINKTSFARNAAVVACKEVANQNDQTRKHFEIMCREVFKAFKACITMPDVNQHKKERDAINIIYKRLQQDREQADISEIIFQLHQVVDSVIDTQKVGVSEHNKPLDISKIDFERLHKEFENSREKNTTVQNLKQAIENKLLKLLQQNPLRTNFQEHYEKIIARYNLDKDRVTIERTFEELLKLIQELDNEELRAAQEGLNEESLAVFDLLKKPDMNATEIKQIKSVAIKLLATLKAKQLRADQWRDKEATRGAVNTAIKDLLFAGSTGLPDTYLTDEINESAEKVYQHVYRAYPTLPSPYYPNVAA